MLNRDKIGSVFHCGLWCLAAAALICSLPAMAASAAHGHVGYLGVDVRDVADDEAVALRLKDSHGAEIIRVDHDAPAGKCGLREHDIVLTLNGIAVEGEEQLRRMLRDLAPGRTVAMTINRDGQTMNVTTQMADREAVERQAWEEHIVVEAPPDAVSGMITLDSVPEVPDAPVPAPRVSRSFIGSLLVMSPSYTGAMLEVMGPQLAHFFGVAGGGGLLVRNVEANSPAAVAGLQAGDVALEANARRLVTTSDWMRAIRESKGQPVTVVVLRDKKQVTVTLTPDGKKRSALELPGMGGTLAFVVYFG
jgi:S1-C subfamily serine protease